MQIVLPSMAGIRKASAVHFMLPVSLRIVRHVVAQGQCTSVKSMTLTAVFHVHPFATSNCFKTFMSPISDKLAWDRYAIMIIGITISFAGSPKINANKITPSIPMSLAGISSTPAKYDNNVILLIFQFAITQRRIPAGAAVKTARPSTNIVLSKTERIITLPICGLR